MKWYQNLYVSKAFAGNEKRIKKKIERRQILPYAYIIALAGNPDNLLEMIPERELVQPYYPRETLKIVGIAENRGSGLEMIRQIIEETWLATGSCDVRSYLAQKGRDFT